MTLSDLRDSSNQEIGINISEFAAKLCESLNASPTFQTVHLLMEFSHEIDMNLNFLVNFEYRHLILNYILYKKL